MVAYFSAACAVFCTSFGPSRVVHTVRIFVNATAIKMGCVDVLYGATAMHLCVFMSHMNELHTHSVRLRCVISICIYTDHSHTMRTSSLKLQKNIVKKCRIVKEINRTV